MRTLVVIACVALAGCAMGPNYKRPSVTTPSAHRGAAPDAAARQSIAETKWFDMFKDDQLKDLVSTALEHNFNLLIATERIQQARAQLGITSADQYPFASVQGTFATQRQSTVGSQRLLSPGAKTSSTYTQAGLALSWELDLWGRLRRLTEAARAQYLASEEGRRAVVVALVGDVMANYFTLRERDMELEIASQTRAIAEDSLRLVELRHKQGVATGLDVRQAEQLLYTATARIANSKREIELRENAISLLVGSAPRDIARGKELDAFIVPDAPPTGLPSTLLERRPDIRAAEQNLVAANARIGAVRALIFPRISLTGFLGGQSRALTSLFGDPARMENLVSSALMPLFNAGQVRAGMRLTESQARELVIAYQRSIYTAFREVSDALVTYQHTREQLAQQELLVQALTESARLSRLRYQGGLDSYLQVLDSQRNLFQGQLALAGLKLQVLNSFVDLYRALGGGWEG